MKPARVVVPVRRHQFDQPAQSARPQPVPAWDGAVEVTLLRAHIDEVGCLQGAGHRLSRPEPLQRRPMARRRGRRQIPHHRRGARLRERDLLVGRGRRTCSTRPGRPDAAAEQSYPGPPPGAAERTRRNWRAPHRTSAGETWWVNYATPGLLERRPREASDTSQAAKRRSCSRSATTTRCSWRWSTSERGSRFTRRM